MAVAKQIKGLIGDSESLEDDFEDEDFVEEEEYPLSEKSVILRVMIKTCPFMNVFYKSSTARLTLDSGAEADLIRRDIAIALGSKIKKTNQSANQADGGTPLAVSGEVSLSFFRDGQELFLMALLLTTWTRRCSVEFHSSPETTLPFVVQGRKSYLAMGLPSITELLPSLRTLQLLGELLSSVQNAPQLCGLVTL